MRAVNAGSLRRRLREIADEYPQPSRGYGFTLGNRDAWAARTVHDVELVASRTRPGATICDVGGGLGLFAVGCRLLGHHAIVVDDQKEIDNEGFGEQVRHILDREGVELHRDTLADRLPVEQELDAVTAFHLLEHLPFSPRPLFRAMRDQLRPGGVFVIAGPNNVNLRKRITVPLGKGSWTSIEDWYDATLFRGHVREPNVGDLRHIARDLELEDPVVLGRNFLGLSKTRSRLAAVGDRVLRARASLCSDLYLVGRRPAAGS